MEVLNVEENDGKTEEDLQSTLKPFLKNHYSNLFQDGSLFEVFNEEFNHEIQKWFFTAEQVQEIMESLDTIALEVFFNKLKNLVLYMQINEPPITH